MLHVFGDSVTKSVSLKDDGGFQTVSDNFLRRAAEACNLPLNNRSIFGATIKKGRQLLKRYSKNLQEGDHVLLAYGGNDCNLPWKLISDHPDALIEAKVPLKEFTSHLSETIDELRGKKLKPLLMNLLPLQPNRFFNTVTSGLRAEIILKKLGDISAIYRWHESYSLSIMTMAAKKCVPLFDARSVFLLHPRYQDLLCSDGMHINDAGQNLLREPFTRFLHHSMAF